MSKLGKKMAVFISCILIISLFTFPASADETSEYSVPLYAGQNQEVGNVYITNDENNIFVRYELNSETVADGWYLTELHLSVEPTKEEIPTNKSGNPVPGKFEFQKSFDFDNSVTSGEFTAPIPEGITDGNVYIAAHAALEKHDVVVNAQANYGADSYLSYEQGPGYKGSTILSTRSDPSQALEYETGRSESNFFSLGFQQYDESGNPTTAYIILEFDNPIINGQGADLQVVEDTWGSPYPLESANIYVSNDNANWVPLGTATNKDMDGIHTFSSFDLPSDMQSAKYVKVEDATLEDDFTSIGSVADGFDLNAVLALHNNETCTVYTETAWGSGQRFVDKGNWGMYFEYPLEHGRILVDTVTVNSDGSSVYSIPLEDNKDYELVASGTYTYIGSTWADAEWYQRGDAVVKGDEEGSKPYVLDVSINGYSNNIDWGEYSESHVYTHPYLGTGDPLKFSIYDSYYGDNNGSITVDIYQVY